MKTKLTLSQIFLGICVAFMLWVVISCVEVTMKNTSTNPEYNSWNFFELFAEKE